MIADIRHIKPNRYRTILQSESATKKECLLPKNEYKNEQKNQNKNKSANVTFTGGFFSPKKQDSVSFSGAPQSTKKGFWNKIGESPRIQNFIKGKTFDKILKAGNDLAKIESKFMFAIAVTIKPITIMALPGAKEEDKKYAATKAFLGGAVDFAIATAAITPITGVINKFNEQLEKNPKIIEKVSYLKDKQKFDSFKKIVEYAPKFLLVPVRSALTIALIPPTLKYLFPEEAKKLKEKKEGKHSIKKLVENTKDLKTKFGETSEGVSK